MKFEALQVKIKFEALQARLTNYKLFPIAGDFQMNRSKRSVLSGMALSALVLSCASFASIAATSPLRVGVVYDLSGPFAGAGATANFVGTEVAFEMFNDRGGVDGQRVQLVSADSQSKADAAINEVERLIGQEKIDIILGTFSSAHAVPLAARLNSQKKFYWITAAISTAVTKEKHYAYVFRPQIHSDQYGQASVAYFAKNSQEKLGIKPTDLRVAIVYEDGPYGQGVSAGNEAAAKEVGMKIVAKEGYSSSSPDLSALITKLRRERPDVILHTGYNPDITLFLRQARTGGLRFKALAGHGAGYSQVDKLVSTFGSDIDYIFNVDAVAAQLLNPANLAPGMGQMTQEFVRRYKEKTNAIEVPAHAAMGFNNTWIFLQNVLKPAVAKYGDATPDSLRKVALEVDIPVGGTVQGYGVKFAAPDHELAGQNLRSSPVVMQYVNGKAKVVWPDAISSDKGILPLPAASPYAVR